MLSKNAEKLLRDRYAYKNETPDDVLKRVAKAISMRDEKFEKWLYNAMINEIFFPNSPCIKNSGKKKGMLHACFCLPLYDSIQSIFETLTNMAVIFQKGGGCGVNFSSLRPRNATLSGGGTSSGVISFMSIYDTTIQVVKQGGWRRGACMGILDYNHPEILDFCRAKIGGKLQNFNLSVLVTDEFMEKATNGGSIDLVHDNEQYGTMKAKDILDLVALGSYICGDPALLFYDRINKDNPLFPQVKLRITNPCQPEYALLLDKDRLKKISSEGKTWSSWSSGIKEVIRLYCNNGLEIDCTPEHKIMLENGDFLEASNCLGKSIKWGLGDRTTDEYDTNEILRGFLFGSGFLTEPEYSVGVKINGSKEPEIHDLLINYGFHKQNCGEYYINKNDLPFDTSFLKLNSHNSEFPDDVLYGSSKKVASFLRGLFSANGSCNKKSGQISLKFVNLDTIKKVQLLLASFGIPSWICKDKKQKIEWNNGIYTNKASFNLQITPKNRRIFMEKIGFLQINKQQNIREKRKYRSKLKVIKIESLGKMEVFDYRMNTPPHYNFCQGAILSNCSEVSLPEWGACCLGSINISKFVEGNNFNFDKFYETVKLVTRALLNMNAISYYPLPQITKVMHELNPVGCGIMGFCYSDDTEILTDQGWKFFQDLNRTEKVATLNPSSGVMEYQNPLDYQIIPYRGFLLHYNKKNYTDLLVTPNHKLFIRDGCSQKIPFSFKSELERTSENIKFKRDFIWIGQNKNFFLKNKEYKIEDYVEFMGWFLSSGYTTKNRVGISKSTSSSYNKQIKLILEKMGFKYGHSKADYIFYNEEWYDYLRQFEISKEKFVPNFIKELTPNLIKIFLKTFAKGSGHKQKENYVLYSSSIKLINDLQELVFKSGGTGSIRVKNKTRKQKIKSDKKSISKKEICYEVIWDLKNGKEFEFKGRPNVVWYDGFVYDVTVPKYHTLLVRRNGKPIWSSNSDALIMLGIKYDSEEALKFIDQLSDPYIKGTEEVAPDSFYKRIIAPTGSLSILAGCSHSIEPIYARSYERRLTVGTFIESKNIYESEFCRTALEISPEWHLKIQAKFQSILDGGLSKTINLPNESSVDDIKKIYILAHKLGVKGVTVFRDGSIEGVLVSTEKKSLKCDDGMCHL